MVTLDLPLQILSNNIFFVVINLSLLLNCENFGLYQNFSAVVTGPESAMRPYESLKRPYESPLVHKSVQASIASNVGKQEKKNKSFSKVPNVKSLLYITNIENKEIIEA